MDRVRLGVVGVGNIAPLNLAGYLEHERCDVVALCDPRSEVAERRAREWNVPSVYTNLGDLLADPDVDAVEILSPTHLHKEHVIAAARAGKHVSCQKPMANSVVGSLARRPRLDRGRGVATVVAQVAAGTAGRCRSPRARTRRCRRGGPGRGPRRCNRSSGWRRSWRRESGQRSRPQCGAGRRRYCHGRTHPAAGEGGGVVV